MTAVAEKVRYLQFGLAAAIIITYGLVLPDIHYGWNLTYEDGIVENIGAFAFLVAAVLFARLFILSSKSGVTYPILFKRRNIIFLLLALLFFFAFGEEISWGQRVFGWQTPEQLKALNLQEETNLHNLEFLNFEDQKMKEKYGVFAVFLSFSPGRLFFYFWTLLLVIIPLINRYSKSWQLKLRSIRMPIAPWWIGAFMIASFILSKIFNQIVEQLYIGNYKTVDEFMEMDYALVFAGLSLYWLWMKAYLDHPLDAE